MLGKGAKRKLDEDEEGLEGEALASAVAAASRPGGGGGGGPTEGSSSIPEGLSKVSYTLQRQTIFNISLMKLYSQRPLTEPSLERRVLINNMLRRIQNELKQEGSLRPLLLPPSPPPDDPMDEGFREAPPSSFGALSSPGGAAAVQPSNQPSPPQSGLLMPVLAPPSPHPLAPPPPASSLSSQSCSSSSAAPLLEACLTPASLLEEDGDSAFCASSSSAPPTPPLSPPPPVALPPSALTPLPPTPLSSLLLGQVGSPRGSSALPSSSNDDSFPSTPTDMELDPPTAILLSRTVSAAAIASSPSSSSTATSTSTTTSPGPSPLAQTASLAPLPPLTPAAGHPRDSSARTIGGPRAEVHSAASTELRPMDILAAHVPMHAPVVPGGGLVDITSSSLSPSSPPSSSPSAGFLSDLALDDILFADIDTSMYDFDPCTTSGASAAAAAATGAGTLGVVTATAAGVAGPGGGLSKLSPVVTADDLLKSLACPYGGPTQQVSANQPFKIDLTELDHIMEVLVGS